MEYKSVKNIDGTRIVEVRCSKTGDLIAIMGLLKGFHAPEIHEINPISRPDYIRMSRHFYNWIKAI